MRVVFPSEHSPTEEAAARINASTTSFDAVLISESKAGLPHSRNFNTTAQISCILKELACSKYRYLQINWIIPRERKRMLSIYKVIMLIKPGYCTYVRGFKAITSQRISHFIGRHCVKIIGTEYLYSYPHFSLIIGNKSQPW